MLSKPPSVTHDEECMGGMKSVEVHGYRYPEGWWAGHRNGAKGPSNCAHQKAPDNFIFCACKHIYNAEFPGNS